MQTTQERVNSVLSGLDTEQIKKIYALLFDVWCWDSGNESIKEIIDVIQKRIEDPTSVMSITPPESSISHTSHGITNELFKFNYGSMSLGHSLEFAIKTYLEENMFTNSNGTIGVSIENQLQNFINNNIFSSWKIVDMDSEIKALRLELDLLKKRLDPEQ